MKRLQEEFVKFKRRGVQKSNEVRSRGSYTDGKVVSD